LRLVDRSFLTAILLLAAAPVAGCGDPEIVNPPTGTGANGGSGGTAGSGGIGGNGGEGNVIVGGGSSTTSTAVDPCDGVACGPDQKCEDQEGAGACVNLTCDEAMCSATEVCDTGPNGGAICKDISCASDVDCPPAQYCDGTICVDDNCAPGVGECSGDDVLVCLPNGSGTTLKYTCGSDAYFTSVCAGDGMGSATCTCEDDWDCPGNTACDVAICEGTGKAPTCSLPPVDFKNALPVNEIQWGGTGSGANKNAVNAPFPASSQVSMTPARRQPRRRQRRRPHQRARLPRDRLHDLLRHGRRHERHRARDPRRRPEQGQGLLRRAAAHRVARGRRPRDGLPVRERDRQLHRRAGRRRSRQRRRPGDRGPQRDDGVTILDNKGVQITASANAQWATSYANPAVAIANLDNAGFAEIVVGRHAFTSPTTRTASSSSRTASPERS
jgi:hypothetical protein